MLAPGLTDAFLELGTGGTLEHINPQLERMQQW